MTRILGILAAAALAGGCATSAPTPSQSAIRTASPIATVAPTPAPTNEFGRVTKVDADTRTVVYRLSQIFDGEAAIAAAREDGEIGPDEGLPNPHYIRDLKVDRERVVPSTAVIRILKPAADGSPQHAGVTPEEYLEKLEARILPEDWYGSPYYDFQVTGDGLVTRIEHIYVP